MTNQVEPQINFAIFVGTIFEQALKIDAERTKIGHVRNLMGSKEYYNSLLLEATKQITTSN